MEELNKLVETIQETPAAHTHITKPHTARTTQMTDRTTQLSDRNTDVVRRPEILHVERAVSSPMDAEREQRWARLAGVSTELRVTL